MSSKTLRKTPKTIGFRLTFWYSALFIVSVSLLFLFAYVYLDATLVRKDHDETLSRLRELKSFYQSGGVLLLIKGISASKKTPEKNKFFIRIADPENRTLYIYLPYQWVAFDIRELEAIPPKQGQWIRIPERDNRVFLEVSSTRLLNGDWLQVGQDTRERQRILDKFRGVTMIIILPLLILGILGGSFLARRALYPLRQLISTVRAIARDMESLDREVPNPHTGDELEELITLFNAMLRRIATLIKAMKNSLDNVAHDLRTPVTRLRCRAELTLQSRDDPEEYRKALEECLEESHEMQRLLDALMDISEAETGVMHLNTRRVQVDQLLCKIADLYDFVAEEKGVSVEVSVQPGLYVMADSTRLGQALANLVDNAIKFTLSGGKVTIEGFREGDSVVIQVRDTGIGIPEKDLPRIWDRLYRGDQSRSQKGLGLGLSLVRAIVMLHKGKVAVESQPGRGTTFTVTLTMTEQPPEESLTKI